MEDKYTREIKIENEHLYEALECREGEIEKLQAENERLRNRTCGIGLCENKAEISVCSVCLDDMLLVGEHNDG